jgi:hypothetical protein
VSDYGYIENGAFTSDADQIVYAWCDLGAKARRIGGAIQWRSGGGANGSTAAFIISSNSDLISNMLHVTVNRSQAKLQKRVSGGAFVDLATISFSPALSLGVAYDVECQITSGKAVLTVNGQSATATDADLESIIGNYVVFECYHPDASMLDLVQFNNVYAGYGTACQRITTTVANGFGQKNIAVPDDSNTHVIQIEVQKKEASQVGRIQAIFVNGSTVTRAGNINLETGAVLDLAAGSAVNVTDAGGFWHIELIGANNGTGNTIMAVTFSPDVSNIGSTADVWGLQVELDKANGTSLIFTDGTSATRAVDNLDETPYDTIITYTPKVMFSDGSIETESNQTGKFDVPTDYGNKTMTIAWGEAA